MPELRREGHAEGGRRGHRRGAWASLEAGRAGKPSLPRASGRSTALPRPPSQPTPPILDFWPPELQGSKSVSFSVTASW